MPVRRLLSLLLATLSLLLFPASAQAQVRSHQVHALKITVLSTMLADGDALGEWGYSALVEVDGHKILFDTGAHPDLVLKNARTLGIDLSKVETVVLSHNHDDHTGGLVTLRRSLMKLNSKALSHVYAGAGIFDQRVNKQGKEANAMLAFRPQYEKLGGRFTIIDHPVELLPGVWLTGPVPRPNNETNWNPGLRRRTANGLVDDIVPEDSSLVFATAQGLVILTGCGHAGIVNITQFATEKTGSSQVLALIGGVHLFAKSDAVIGWTAQTLKPYGVKYLLAGHCTGIEATYKLRALLGLDRKTAVVSAVGSSFTLGKGIDPGEIAA
jgi:7,8-dihydropterin-6-yl-methyl-4-(beta-D-ribofuranosyl)aminobenzene 5'-phosphate synthase